MFLCVFCVFCWECVGRTVRSIMVAFKHDKYMAVIQTRVYLVYCDTALYTSECESVKFLNFEIYLIRDTIPSLHIYSFESFC